MYQDFAANLLQSGWQAALIPSGGRHQLVLNSMAYLIGGEYEKAWESWLMVEPNWANPDQWPRMMSAVQSNRGGCYPAGLMISAGQPGGQELLAMALEYMESHYADQEGSTFEFWNLGLCYLLDGSFDQAFEFWERYISNGHWTDFRWFMIERFPWWNPVLDDPRHPELMNHLAEEKEAQRVLVENMEETFPAIP